MCLLCVAQPSGNIFLQQFHKLLILRSRFDEPDRKLPLVKTPGSRKAANRYKPLVIENLFKHGVESIIKDTKVCLSPRS